MAASADEKVGHIVTGGVAAVVLCFVMFVFVQYRGAPDPDASLPILYQPRVLFAIGSIIGTSMVMMWFEVLFARWVLLPQTNSQVVKVARDVGRLITPGQGVKPEDLVDQGSIAFLPEEMVDYVFDVDSTTGLPRIQQEMDPVAYTLAQAEERKIRKNNNYAFLSVLYPFMFLAFLLYLIHLRLYVTGRDNGYKHLLSWTHTRAMIGGIVLSVIVFGSFQYVFYLFARKYKYISIEQIRLNMTKEVRDSVC